MKKFLYGVLNLFLFILTGLFIFKLLSPLYDGLIIKGDCLSFMWWGESTFLETFTKNEHTCFILAMFNCICGRYLPELFKIHPQVWYLLQFSFLANFSKYFKNKKFNILWLFLIFPSFLFLMINAWADWIITDDCWSFAYIFMPVFSIVFLLECEKIYVQNQVEIFEPKKNYYQKIVLFLLFICVASSYEFQRFVTCAALFFGYFLHYFFVNKNLNHKKSILIYLFVIIINLLMFFVPSAQNYIGRLKLPDIVAIFPKYMSLYFKNFIVGNSELFLAIILLVLCAIFFAPKTSLQKNTHSESHNTSRPRPPLFRKEILLSIPQSAQELPIWLTATKEHAPFLISNCRCYQIRSRNRNKSLMAKGICFRIVTKPPNYTCVTNLRSMKFCLQNMQIFSYLAIIDETFFLFKRNGSKQYLM